MATWILIFLVFITPWENVIVIGGLGTLARLVGIALFGAFVLTVSATGVLRRPTRFHIVSTVFSMWAVTTLAWSVAFVPSALFAMALLQLVVLTYVVYGLLDNPLAHEHALLAGVLGGYVVSAMLIFNGLTGNVSEWDRRATIANSNENDIGIVLALLMSVAWYFTTHSDRSNLVRAFSALYIPTAFIAIIFTASRTSLLVTLVFAGTVLFSLARASKVQKAISSVTIATAGVLVLFAAPETSLERLGTIQSSFERGDFGSRQYFWGRAWDLISEDGPTTIVGYGLGTFDTLVGDSAHQTFLALIVEVGVVGVALFTAVLVIVVQHIKTLDGAKRQMWGSMMLMWFIGVQTLSWHFFTFTWLLFALIVADGSWKRAEPDRSVERSEPILDLRTSALRS